MSDVVSSRGRATRIIVLICVLGASTVYAYLRYIVFGGVPAVSFPVYVVNKILAISSGAGLMLAGVASLRGRPEGQAFWARAVGTLALGHILLSLAIINDTYFPKFFDGERLNLTGELVILLGVLCSLGLMPWLRSAANGGPGRLIGAVTSLLLAGHVLAMGLAGWLTPGKWHGGMPPISLIGFVVALVAAAALAGGTSKTNAPD